MQNRLNLCKKDLRIWKTVVLDKPGHNKQSFIEQVVAGFIPAQELVCIDDDCRRVFTKYGLQHVVRKNPLYGQNSITGISYVINNFLIKSVKEANTE